MSNWKPDKNSEISLYKQIASHIREQVKSGELTRDGRLSVRRCAKAYDVSHITVIEAFDLLKSEGVLESIPRSGTRVSGNAWQRLLSNTPDWGKIALSGRQASNDEYWAEAARRANSPDTLKLSGLSLDPATFHPEELFENTIKAVGDPVKMSKTAYEYSIFGLPHLREAVVEHLRQYGIETDTDSVIIFNSNVDSMFAVFNSLLRPGMNFFVMEYDIITRTGIVPTFGSILQSIPLSGGRYDFDFLRSRVKRKESSMLYISCTNHIPTGYTLDQRERDDLMDICNELGLPVLEVDTYRDFWTERPPQPLKASDENDLVLYRGNFSNMTYIGLRLSWMVIPESLKNRIHDVKIQLFGSNSTLLEEMAHEMLVKKHYENYMAKVRSLLPARIDALDALMHKYLDGLAVWNKKDIVYNVWVRFNPGIDTNRLFMECPGIYFGAEKAFGSGSSHIAFSALSAPLGEIELGLKYIVSAAEKQQF